MHDLRIKGEEALLVEAEINGKQDKAFVGERAHLESGLYAKTNAIPEEYLHKNQNEAEKAFIQSMTPLEDYVTKQQSREGFSLPEVVILNPIPTKKIIVSAQQPLIEDSLARSRGQDREYLVLLITKGWAQPELEPWRTSYEKRFGNLEQQARGKEAF